MGGVVGVHGMPPERLPQRNGLVRRLDDADRGQRGEEAGEARLDQGAMRCVRSTSTGSSWKLSTETSTRGSIPSMPS